MNWETRAAAVAKLDDVRQAAFCAAALEHALRSVGASLEDRGLGELVAKARNVLWQSAAGEKGDASKIKRTRDACARAAPNTEDEPDAGEVTYTMVAFANACNVVTGVKRRGSVRSLVANIIFGVAHVGDDQSDADWEKQPNVVAEGQYQDRLLARLQAGGHIDRSALVDL